MFLFFGDPSPFAADMAKAGAVLTCQVQFLSQIGVALKAAAAAVVVQFRDAGFAAVGEDHHGFESVGPKGNLMTIVLKLHLIRETLE